MVGIKSRGRGRFPGPIEIEYLNNSPDTLKAGGDRRDKLHVDAVISALPAPVLADITDRGMLGRSTPELQVAIQALRSIEYCSVGVVNMGFKRSDLIPARGFGYLAPSVEVIGQ